MDWYLLKTWTGQEEELVKEIRRSVPQDLYQECFVIYQERIWRRQQKSIVHVEPLFPGCVFFTCQGRGVFGKADGMEGRMEERTSFFRRLEGESSLAQRMACGDLVFFPVMKEDVEFLTAISGKDHVVRLSYVEKNDQGQIDRISEPLKTCQRQIERIQFKKRYAMVRHKLWGEERAIVLGIMLKEDREARNQSAFLEAFSIREGYGQDHEKYHGQGHEESHRQDCGKNHGQDCEEYHGIDYGKNHGQDHEEISWERPQVIS